MAQLIESNRAGAEVFTGHNVCKQKAIDILVQNHLPRALLSVGDIEELGYNRSSGFLWIKSKKDSTHSFKNVGKTVSYAKEVTAFVHDKKMTNLSGVKVKELMIWISLSGMAIEDPEGKKLSFSTPAGIGKTFPVDAFDE
ncbi:hypothetical protein LUZ63_015114 [Rhynchospora breviuscula]|uniref:Uncharacterized protein n=1 Tax=Rhynchospora breviuscula TaxID=2022672 RepID=A0A9Q0HM44_9POAL|nr:hypothetical protein LUZ63_015114 [Rhynchospora breviuscula]